MNKEGQRALDAIWLLRRAVDAEKTARHLGSDEDVIGAVVTLPQGNLTPARYYDAIEHLETMSQIAYDDDTDAAYVLLSNIPGASEEVKAKITPAGIDDWIGERVTLNLHRGPAAVEGEETSRFPAFCTESILWGLS